jgi:hypothetical protein
MPASTALSHLDVMDATVESSVMTPRGEQIRIGLASDVVQIAPALIRTASRNADGHRTLDLAGPLQSQLPTGILEPCDVEARAMHDHGSISKARSR